MISEIRVSNFKSFNEIKQKLNRFNVLIGANASGKSNFVSVFNFLHDLAKHGLKDAISMHGGNEYIKNLNLDKNHLSIGFSFNFSKNEYLSIIDDSLIEYSIEGINVIDYDLTINFKEKYHSIEKEEIIFKSKKIKYNIDRIKSVNYSFLRINDDISIIKKQLKDKIDPELKLKLENELLFLEERMIEISEMKDKVKDVPKELKEKIKGITHLTIKRSDNEYHFFLQGKNNLVRIENSPIFSYFGQKEISENKCFFESNLLFQFKPFAIIKKFLNDMSLYDIDPKSAKNISLITGKTELEPDGSNLVIALRNLSEKTIERKKFIQLLKEFLPFIDDIETEKIADRLFLTTLKEKYSQKIFIPAPLISDGTMNISALLYILLFEEKPFLIFEEPERNLHPRLVSKLINLMKDVSERMQEKQIIITTHNPQILKYTAIENLLLIYRDEEGFSQITLPSQNEQVKNFLENEIGIDELFIQNLLG